MEARTFREAYGVLQNHAETLREQAEPNIDSLLSIVTESVAAYKVCKERIDAVENDAVRRAKEVAGAADVYVRENPWQAVGVAAGIGLLLGVMLSRRS